MDSEADSNALRRVVNITRFPQVRGVICLLRANFWGRETWNLSTRWTATSVLSPRRVRGLPVVQSEMRPGEDIRQLAAELSRTILASARANSSSPSSTSSSYSFSLGLCRERGREVFRRDFISGLTHISTPSAPATVSISLSPLPLSPSRMICSLSSFGASCDTWYTACDGSSAGIIPSVRHRSWNPSSA